MIKSDRGVIYVAYGERARNETIKSISSLRSLHPNLPVSVVSDQQLSTNNQPGSIRFIHYPDEDVGARIPKLLIDQLSPYHYTLYLDADTRVYQSLSSGFDILHSGWDMAITPSTQQGGDFLWKCSTSEIVETMNTYSFNNILSLQGGVIFFQKTRPVHNLFSVWREEWQKYKDQDQGALLRALRLNPLRLWLLGRPWNGGAIVSHLFGRAKRES